MYRAENGKILDDSVVIGRKRQEQMATKGWSFRVVNSQETAQEAYDRIHGGFPNRIVRIYSATTAIRGYHNHFAVVKMKGE